MRKLILIALTAGLLGCGAEALEDTRPAPVTTSASIDAVVRASGEIASRQSAILGPPAVENVWNFTIAYMAPEGTLARPGMPVLRFETQELQERLIEKQAQLDNTQSQLRRAQIANKEQIDELELEIERLISEADKAAQKAALPESVLAKKDYREHQLRDRLAKQQLAGTRERLTLTEESLRTDEALLQADVAKLEREVAQLTESIDRMTVKAPRDGLVLHLRRWGREKIAQGDRVWFGMRVMELPDLAQLVLKLEVAERDLNRIAEGLPIEFTIDASPDQAFTGRIESLGRIVRTRSTNQPAMIIDAVASIDAPDAELMRPGMRVSAEIVLEGA
ncbi:MAG: efflux RND transporter periplasmic adaptor subunit [Pseudomonadota bacterium]